MYYTPSRALHISPLSLTESPFSSKTLVSLAAVNIAILVIKAWGWWLPNNRRKAQLAVCVAAVGASIAITCVVFLTQADDDDRWRKGYFFLLLLNHILLVFYEYELLFHVYTESLQLQRWFITGGMIFAYSIFLLLSESILLHDASLEAITILFFSIAIAYLHLLIGYIILTLGTFQWSVIAHALLCLLISGIALGLSIKSYEDNSNFVLFAWILLTISNACPFRILIRQSIEYWGLVAKFNQFTQRYVSPDVDTERGHLKDDSLASSETEDARSKEEVLDIEDSHLKGNFLVLPNIPNVEAGRQYIWSGSRILLHRTFDFKLYTLARLSKLGDHNRRQILEAIDKHWRLGEVLSIIELPDESFELVVLESSFRNLESQLLEIFPGCHLEQDDPTEPDEEEVKTLHYVKAKCMRIEAFRKRVEHMDQEGHSIAAAFYSQRWNAVEQELG